MKLSEPYKTVFKWLKRILFYICFIIGVFVSTFIIYFTVIWISDTYRTRYLGDDYAIITDDCSNPGLYKILLKGIPYCAHSQRYIFTQDFGNPSKYQLIDKESGLISEPMTSDEFLHVYDSLDIKYEFAHSILRSLIDDHEQQKLNAADNKQ